MENIEENLRGIEQQTAPEVTELPFDLLERQENKTTRLVANSGRTVPIEGKNVSFKYKFKEPVGLSYLKLAVSGYDSYDRFRFKVKNLAGEEKTFTANPAESAVYCDIDEICESVSFEPPRAWLRKPTIQSVELSGFKIADAAKFIRFAVNLDETKAEILQEATDAKAEAQSVIDSAAQAQTELNATNSQISDGRSALDKIHEDQKAATNKLNELTAKIGASAKQVEGIDERLSNLQGDVKVETQKKNSSNQIL